MLRIFTPVKIQRLRPGLNPQTWVPDGSMLTTRPPKPSSSLPKDPCFRGLQIITVLRTSVHSDVSIDRPISDVKIENFFHFYEYTNGTDISDSTEHHKASSSVQKPFVIPLASAYRDQTFRESCSHDRRTNREHTRTYRPLQLLCTYPCL